MNTKRLTKKQMIIFAIGQLGWSTLSGIVTAWLVTFYMPTEAGATVYIRPGFIIVGITIIGLISALGRVFDAITDPLIASLSDRSKNPRGRRMPFMQIAAIPLAIVSVLLFWPMWGEMDPLNIVWLSIMLVLFYLFMTMYCTPYNSLISEFGKTQEDRMFISTAISLTFFVGTLLAYTPFAIAPALRSMGVQFDWSYRIVFIVLAVIAAVAMLLPTFLIKEKEYVDTKPSEVNVFKSLGATFKNHDFRVFVGSDLMYWVGLTMFQTGLPFFVKVSMRLPESMGFVLLAAMTVLSAVFYPFVTKLVTRFGKKKLVIIGFIGLSIAYAIVALTGFTGNYDPDPALRDPATVVDWIMAFTIVVVAAFPMALLGIIPQSIVADVAEAEGITTGENREGMFFAARTFAMKFGQSLALILFTSLAITGVPQDMDVSEIKAGVFGLRLVAIVALAFCVAGAAILLLYREKRVMEIIAKEGDEKFMRAVKDNPKKKKENI